MNSRRILVWVVAIPALLATGCGDTSSGGKNERQVNERTPPTIGHFLNGAFEVVAVFRDGELSNKDSDLAAIFTFRPKEDHGFDFARADESESRKGIFGSVDGHRLGFKFDFENGNVIQGNLSTRTDSNRKFIESTDLENPPSKFYLLGYMIPSEPPAKSIEYYMKKGGAILVVQEIKNEEN